MLGEMITVEEKEEEWRKEEEDKAYHCWPGK